MIFYDETGPWIPVMFKHHGQWIEGVIVAFNEDGTAQVLTHTKQVFTVGEWCAI